MTDFAKIVQKPSDLKEFLDQSVDRFNRPEFIKSDPISIPHRFTLKQDIEIMGFWTAMLAWGRRETIISKSLQLIELMDGNPFEFIVNHREQDRKALLSFKHRTFQATDTLYFLEFLQQYYRKNESLEDAFSDHLTPDDTSVENAIAGFHKLFFSLPGAPSRTKKHIATPAKNASCKRLNMFLRWMVRKDDKGVDFGLWQKIKPSQLMMPLDVHVQRVGLRLNLLQRTQSDWKAVEELTNKLRNFDANDPVKYDFALFGLGVPENSFEFGK